MKCELCGKDYVNLGVHLRHKHKVDPDDYREEFGILRVTPLVDQALSEHIRAQIKIRLRDPDYKEEATARCLENAAANRGKPGPGMSKAGKESLARRNAEANARYLNEMAPVVAKILDEKKTVLDVRRDIGMGANAVKSIVRLGKAVYDKDVAAIVATQRRVAARAENKARKR